MVLLLVIVKVTASFFRSFKRFFDMEIHFYTHMGIKGKSPVCSLCGENFLSPGGVRRHVRNGQVSKKIRSRSSNTIIYAWFCFCGQCSKETSM